MANAGTLRVSLTAEQAQFVKAMHDAASSVTALTVAAGVGIEKIAEFGAHLAKEAVEGLYEFAKSGFEAMDALGKLSDKTALSATFLSTLQGHVKSVGGDVEGFNVSIEHLVHNLGKISENKELQDTLRRLHIPLSEIKGMNAEGAFRRIADGIKGIESPSIQAAMAQEFFGKNWMSVIGILRDGSAGIDEATQRMIELGAVFDDLDVSKVQIASNSVNQLGLMASAAGEALAEEFAPIIQEVVQSTIHWIKVNGGLRNVVHELFDYMVKGAGWTADAVQEMVAIFELVKAAITGVMWAVVQPFKRIIEFIDSAAKKVEEAVNYMIDVWNKFGDKTAHVHFTEGLDDLKNLAVAFSDDLAKETGKTYNSALDHYEKAASGAGSAAVKEWVDDAIAQTNKLAESMVKQKEKREKTPVGAGAMPGHMETSLHVLQAVGLGGLGAMKLEHKVNPELDVLKSIDKTLKKSARPTPAFGLAGI